MTRVYAFVLMTSSFLMVTAQSASGQAREPAVFFLKSHQDSIWVRHFPPTGDRQSFMAVLLVPGWPAVGMDVIGLGHGLSARGVHAFVVHPRGHAESSGEASFSHALEDVAVVWEWMSSPDGGGSMGVDPGQRTIAGYSWGGGIALAFAAQERSVGRVVSIAGSDHGAFVRRVDNDADYGAFYRRALESTRAPDGPVRFDVEATLEELRANEAQHDLVTIASRLLTKDILIIAGWDDDQVELEHQVLPFYRAMRSGGARSLRAIAYQDDHGFSQVRERLTDDLSMWLLRER